MKNNASLPAWGCGLKSTYLIEELPPDKVTPCVGVWIEMLWGMWKRV